MRAVSASSQVGKASFMTYGDDDGDEDDGERVSISLSAPSESAAMTHMRNAHSAEMADFGEVQATTVDNVDEFDVLAWWWEKEAKDDGFLRPLARLARTVLTSPATEFSVERLFSEMRAMVRKVSQ